MDNEKLLKLTSIYISILKNDDCLHKFGDSEINITEKGFDLKVNCKISLPYFTPTINKDTNEIWYICNDEEIDLKYTERDDKYVFNSKDEEIINFFKEVQIVAGVKL